MANVCSTCGKKPVAGNNVSHSMRHTKRVFKPNLVVKKVTDQGTTKKIKVCTRCLRSMIKKAA